MGRGRRAWHTVVPVVVAAGLVGLWGSATQTIVGATHQARSVAEARAAEVAARSGTIRYLQYRGRTVVRIAVPGPDVGSGRPAVSAVSAVGDEVVRHDGHLAAILGRGDRAVGLPPWAVELPGEIVVVEPVSAAVDGTVDAPDPAPLASLEATALIVQAALAIPALAMLVSAVVVAQDRRAGRRATLAVIGADPRLVRCAEFAMFSLAATGGAIAGAAAATAIAARMDTVAFGWLQVDVGAGIGLVGVLVPAAAALVLSSVAVALSRRPSRRARSGRRTFVLGAASTGAGLAGMWWLGGQRPTPPTAPWSIGVAVALGTLLVANPAVTRLAAHGIGLGLGRTRRGPVAGARLTRRPQLFAAVSAAIAVQVAFTFLITGFDARPRASAGGAPFEMVIRLNDTEETGQGLSEQLLARLGAADIPAAQVDYSYVTIDGRRAGTVASTSCADLRELTAIAGLCDVGIAWSTGGSVTARTIELRPATRPTRRRLEGTFDLEGEAVGLVAAGDQPVFVVAGDYLGTTRDVLFADPPDRVLEDLVSILDAAPPDAGALHLVQDLRVRSSGRDDPDRGVLRLGAVAIALLLGAGVTSAAVALLRSLRREDAVEWALGRSRASSRLDQVLMVAVATLAATTVASVTGITAGALFAGRTPDRTTLAWVLASGLALVPLSIVVVLLTGVTAGRSALAELRAD